MKIGTNLRIRGWGERPGTRVGSHEVAPVVDDLVAVDEAGEAGVGRPGPGEA